jgi:hypothetical protein
MILAFAAGELASAQSATGPTILPACPQTTYAVDGTIGPLFCTIDDPVALSWYAKPLRPLLALGPNASPGAVGTALQATLKHSSYPQLCQIYGLAARAERWHFAVDPVAVTADPDC